MLFTCPSSASPGRCSYSIETPNTWLARAVPPAELVLIDQQASADYQVNLTVRTERLDIAIGLAQISEAISRGVPADPAVDIQATEPAQIGGFDAVLRVQTVSLATVQVPLFQAEALINVPTANAELTDLIMVHGTCLVQDAATYGPIFRSIIDSMKIQPWEP